MEKYGIGGIWEVVKVRERISDGYITERFRPPPHHMPENRSYTEGYQGKEGNKYI